MQNEKKLHLKLHKQEFPLFRLAHTSPHLYCGQPRKISKSSLPEQKEKAKTLRTAELPKKKKEKKIIKQTGELKLPKSMKTSSHLQQTREGAHLRHTDAIRFVTLQLLHGIIYLTGSLLSMSTTCAKMNLIQGTRRQCHCFKQ